MVEGRGEIAEHECYCCRQGIDSAQGSKRSRLRIDWIQARVGHVWPLQTGCYRACRGGCAQWYVVAESWAVNGSHDNRGGQAATYVDVAARRLYRIAHKGDALGDVKGDGCCRRSVEAGVSGVGGAGRGRSNGKRGRRPNGYTTGV